MARSEWRSRVRLEADICKLDGVGCCTIVTDRPILLMHYADHYDCKVVASPSRPSKPFTLDLALTNSHPSSMIDEARSGVEWNGMDWRNNGG